MQHYSWFEVKNASESFKSQKKRSNKPHFVFHCHWRKHQQNNKNYSSQKPNSIIFSFSDFPFFVNIWNINFEIEWKIRRKIHNYFHMKNYCHNNILNIGWYHPMILLPAGSTRSHEARAFHTYICFWWVSDANGEWLKKGIQLSKRFETSFNQNDSISVFISYTSRRTLCSGFRVNVYSLRYG